MAATTIGVLADIQALHDQLDVVERDARAIADGLDEASGTWCPAAESWSVAECFDHLATANRVYLQAMEPAAIRARERGRLRRGPAVPGFVGRWFVRTLEPPVNARTKLRAPKAIRPREAPPFADAVAAFLASHDDVRAWLRAHADLDLASVRFVNPFIPGLRFSLATGLHVIASHERRHLWQASRVCEAAERGAVA